MHANLRKPRLLTTFALTLCIFLSDHPAPSQTARESAQMIDSLSELPVGLGTLRDPPIPKENPQAPGKVHLGRKLFFDTRLSADDSISCATCHDPRRGFSDGRPRALGFHGIALPRD